MKAHNIYLYLYILVIVNQVKYVLLQNQIAWYNLHNLMTQANWEFIGLLFCSIKVFLIKVILSSLGSNIITYSCWVFQSCSIIRSLKLEENSRLSTGMLFTVTKNILVFPSGAQVRPYTFDITFIYFSVAFDVGSYICSDFYHFLPFCDAFFVCSVSKMPFPWYYFSPSQ